MSLTDLTAQQVNEFKEVFSLFDVNNDGQVSTKELGTVMRSLGQNPTEVGHPTHAHQCGLVADCTVRCWRRRSLQPWSLKSTKTTAATSSFQRYATTPIRANAMLLARNHHCVLVWRAKFATMMAQKMQEATSAEKLIESFRVRRVPAAQGVTLPLTRFGVWWQVFDKERSGFVSVAEFRHINEVGDEKIPEDVLEQMISYADKDGVGQINYEEFVKRLVGPSA